MKNNFKCRIYHLTAIFLFSMIFFINQVSAADMKVVPSNITVIRGEKFDLNIYVDPSGAEIAGAQLKIEFNNSMLMVNDVIEGELFKQGGTNTFFNKDISNNPSTTTINVYGAILGPYSVSTMDAFVIINVTSKNSTGNTFVNFSDVKISDPSGNYVPTELYNGSVSIIQTPFNVPEPLFIYGRIVDSLTKAGISGVTVSTNTSYSTLTNASGFYSLPVSAGTYDLKYILDPIYYPNNNTLSITSGYAVIPDIEFIKKPTGTIAGMVTKN